MFFWWSKYIFTKWSTSNCSCDVLHIETLRLSNWYLTYNHLTLINLHTLNHELNTTRSSVKTRKHWTVVSNWYGTQQQQASTTTPPGIERFAYRPLNQNPMAYMSNTNQLTILRNPLPLPSITVSYLI